MANRRQNGEGCYTYLKKQQIWRFRINGKAYYGKTKTEARNKYLDELKTAQMHDVTRKTAIFAELAEEWLHTQANTLSPTTYDGYEINIKNQIVQYKGYPIGCQQIAGMMPAMVQKYVAALCQDYAPATIQKALFCLKATIKYGMEVYGYFSPQLLKAAKQPNINNIVKQPKEVDYLTEDETERLYQETLRKRSSGRYYYGDAARVIVLCMYSGMRISEIVGLRWKYVDLGNRCLRVNETIQRVIARDADQNALIDDNGQAIHRDIVKTPKSKSGRRSLPLPSRAMEMLEYFGRMHPDHQPDDLVCVTGNGTRYDRSNVLKCLKRILVNCGYAGRNLTTHSLRHIYITELYRMGADPITVSWLAGHSRPQTTMQLYGYSNSEAMRAAVDLFDAV